MRKEKHRIWDSAWQSIEPKLIQYINEHNNKAITNKRDEHYNVCHWYPLPKQKRQNRARGTNKIRTLITEVGPGCERGTKFMCKSKGRQ